MNAQGNGAESDEVSVVAAGVEVTPTTLAVAEGATKTYAVKLTRPPPGQRHRLDLGRPATGTSASTGPRSPSPPGNWNTAQQVTVSARADADFVAGTTTFAHTARSQDPSYKQCLRPKRHRHRD